MENYFENLANYLREESAANAPLVGVATAYLTVKVDIDCKIYCDGDFLDFFEANKVKKISVQTGWHLFTIESGQFGEVSEDYEIDVAEAGKNYPLLVKGLKQKEDAMIQKAEEDKRKAEEEAKRKAEMEAKRKVEEEARRRVKEEETRRKAEEEAKRRALEEKFADLGLSFEKMREILVRLFSARDNYGFSWHLDGWGDRKTRAENNTKSLIEGKAISLHIEDPDNEKNKIEKIIDLFDIVSGLKKAANGSFKSRNIDEREKVKQHYYKLLDTKYDFEEGYEASYLIQIIVFDELTYTHRDEDLLEQLGPLKWD